MTSPDPAAILAQINAAREQTYQNIELAQGILTQANQAAAAAAQDRAAIQAIAQQTVSVDTSVGTRVFAGDVMIYGDTGWRDVTSLLLNGWSVSNSARPPMMRRLGDMVQMDIPALGLTGADATDSNFIKLPIGFQPAYNYGVAGTVTLDSEVRPARFNIGGTMYISDGEYSAGLAGQLQWRVSGPRHVPWPTSLPGTPA